MIQPRQVAVYRPVVAPHRPGQLEGDVLRHAGLQLPSEGVLVQVVRIVLDVHLQDDRQRVNLWKKRLTSEKCLSWFGPVKALCSLFCCLTHHNPVPSKFEVTPFPLHHHSVPVYPICLHLIDGVHPVPMYSFLEPLFFRGRGFNDNLRRIFTFFFFWFCSYTTVVTVVVDWHCIRLSRAE